MRPFMVGLLVVSALAAGCDELGTRGLPSALVFRESPIIVETGTSTAAYVQALDSAGTPLDGVRLRWTIAELAGIDADLAAGERTASRGVRGLAVGGLARADISVGSEVDAPLDLPLVVATDEDASVTASALLHVVPPSRDVEVVATATCAAVVPGKPVRVRAQTVVGGRPSVGRVVLVSVVPAASAYRVSATAGAVGADRVRTESSSAPVDGVVVDGVVEVEVTAVEDDAPPALLFFDVLGSDASGTAMKIASSCR